MTSPDHERGHERTGGVRGAINDLLGLGERRERRDEHGVHDHDTHDRDVTGDPRTGNDQHVGDQHLTDRSLGDGTPGAVPDQRNPGAGQPGAGPDGRRGADDLFGAGDDLGPGSGQLGEADRVGVSPARAGRPGPAEQAPGGIPAGGVPDDADQAGPRHELRGAHADAPTLPGTHAPSAGQAGSYPDDRAGGPGSAPGHGLDPRDTDLGTSGHSTVTRDDPAAHDPATTGDHRSDDARRDSAVTSNAVTGRDTATTGGDHADPTVADPTVADRTGDHHPTGDPARAGTAADPALAGRDADPVAGGPAADPSTGMGAGTHDGVHDHGMHHGTGTHHDTDTRHDTDTDGRAGGTAGHAAGAGAGNVAAGAATGAGAAAGAGHAGSTAAPESAGSDGEGRERLIPQQRATEYGSRWDQVKGDFVDEPRRAVAGADALVGELLDELQELFSRQRSSLDQGLDKDETSTEDLRLALRRYRSFFDRLLSI
jgi:hypothetical protein